MVVETRPTIPRSKGISCIRIGSKQYGRPGGIFIIRAVGRRAGVHIPVLAGIDCQGVTIGRSEVPPGGKRVSICIYIPIRRVGCVHRPHPPVVNGTTGQPAQRDAGAAICAYPGIIGA